MLGVWIQENYSSRESRLSISLDGPCSKPKSDFLRVICTKNLKFLANNFYIIEIICGLFVDYLRLFVGIFADYLLDYLRLFVGFSRIVISLYEIICQFTAGSCFGQKQLLAC